MVAIPSVTSYTQHTKTSLDAIMAEVRKARAQGFALTEQETSIGDISLAAPVRNPDGRATPAINISVSVADWTGAELALRLGPTIVEAARAISGASGFRPMPPA